MSTEFVPKYTMRFTIEDKNENEKEYLIDADYANMARLRDELTLALKSLNSPFSKKVFKFMK